MPHLLLLTAYALACIWGSTVSHAEEQWKLILAEGCEDTKLILWLNHDKPLLNHYTPDLNQNDTLDTNLALPTDLWSKTCRYFHNTIPLNAPSALSFECSYVNQLNWAHILTPHLALAWYRLQLHVPAPIYCTLSTLKHNQQYIQQYTTPLILRSCHSRYTLFLANKQSSFPYTAPSTTMTTYNLNEKIPKETEPSSLADLD